MNIKRYGIRDLHRSAPDDYTYAAFDLVIETEDGEFFHSEALFETHSEVLDLHSRREELDLDYWGGMPVERQHLGVVTWLES